MEDAISTVFMATAASIVRRARQKCLAVSTSDRDTRATVGFQAVDEASAYLTPTSLLSAEHAKVRTEAARLLELSRGGFYRGRFAEALEQIENALHLLDECSGTITVAA